MNKTQQFIRQVMAGPWSKMEELWENTEDKNALTIWGGGNKFRVMSRDEYAQLLRYANQNEPNANETNDRVRKLSDWYYSKEYWYPFPWKTEADLPTELDYD